MYDIGIDLGTSAVKLLLLSDEGQVVRTVSRSYPLSFPQPGWSEQNPEDWWSAIVDGMPELLEGVDRVGAIGVAGQMHGLVALDADDHVLRPAILWNDGRTAEETDYLNQQVGTERLQACTGNIAFAGFTAPKLLWMKKNEPDLFARIHKVLLPKDYINYRLTGVFATDYSDAAGMLLLDVAGKCWSEEMLAICGLTDSQMPALHESSDIIGSVLADVAAQLGLPGHETLHLQNESGDSGSPDGEAAAGSQPDNTNPDCEAAAASQAGNNGHYVSVVAGAGDNAAAAVGTGCLHEGQCNLSLGTSGTIFLPCESFRMDPTGATHAFAHAAGNYHLMGCMLSAASCLKWWVEEICESTDYEGLQASINPDNLGKNHVFFLPYLMGERAPLNDPYARGAFAGMRMDTTRAEMTQAVLEGVAFAFRDMAESARALGITINHSTLCGGGAKSDVWKTILANVLNVRLDLLEEEQGPGLGAAMLAARGRGRYASLDEAADQIVKFCGSISPDPELTACYEERYQVFRKIYPAMKELYRAM